MDSKPESRVGPAARWRAIGCADRDSRTRAATCDFWPRTHRTLAQCRQSSWVAGRNATSAQRGPVCSWAEAQSSMDWSNNRMHDTLPACRRLAVRGVAVAVASLRVNTCAPCMCGSRSPFAICEIAARSGLHTSSTCVAICWSNWWCSQYQSAVSCLERLQSHPLRVQSRSLVSILATSGCHRHCHRSDHCHGFSCRCDRCSYHCRLSL
jgi:hypothetical protein